MKSICSNGGPLIGLDISAAHLWSGIDGNSFVGRASPFATDYEAACGLMVGEKEPPGLITKLVGESAEALLITMPVETAIIAASPSRIQIVQVEAAEPDWSFSEVSSNDFESASLRRRFTIESSGGIFVLFDACSKFEEVDSDYLCVRIECGFYGCSDAIYSKVKWAELNLIDLTKSY